MPRSPKKKASKKGKGKAPAARNRPSPWSRTDLLLTDRVMQTPPLNSLHRVAIALLTLHAGQQEANNIGLISIQLIMVEVDKYLGLKGLERIWSYKTRLRNVRDALSSFEDKDLLAWDGLQSESDLDEAVNLAPALRSILDELLAMTQTQMSGVNLSSLTTSQHRALGLWFRGLAKELGFRNLTKHDMRITNDALKKSAGGATPGSSDQPHPNDGGNADVDMDSLSDHEALTNQNAVAGPSRQPQTPGRSRAVDTARAYPTPDSRPRKNRSGLHDDAAQAGPRIAAVSLPTPADTDSDGGDFQDAIEEIVLDETLLTNQERDLFLQQIYELQETIKRLEQKNKGLEKENINLASTIEGLDAQITKERDYMWKKLQERRSLRAVEDARWKIVSLWRRGRNARIEQLNDEIAEARADITWYKNELNKLQDLTLQTEAEMATLQQTVAEQADQLRMKEELLQSTDSFWAVYTANRQRIG